MRQSETACVCSSLRLSDTCEDLKNFLSLELPHIIYRVHSQSKILAVCQRTKCLDFSFLQLNRCSAKSKQVTPYIYATI